MFHLLFLTNLVSKRTHADFLDPNLLCIWLLKSLSCSFRGLDDISNDNMMKCCFFAFSSCRKNSHWLKKILRRTIENDEGHLFKLLTKKGVIFNFYQSLDKTMKVRRKRRRSDPVIWQNPLYQQKIRKPKDNTQTPPNTSITRWLRTDLGRSVGVTNSSVEERIIYMGFSTMIKHIFFITW